MKALWYIANLSTVVLPYFTQCLLGAHSRSPVRTTGTSRQRGWIDGCKTAHSVVPALTWLCAQVQLSHVTRFSSFMDYSSKISFSNITQFKVCLKVYFVVCCLCMACSLCMHKEPQSFLIYLTNKAGLAVVVKKKMHSLTKWTHHSINSFQIEL